MHERTLVTERTSDDRPRGTARLRLLNTQRLLATVRGADQPMSIAELSTATALTRPTVTQIVTTLEDRGWLRRFEPIAAAGRPAARYGVAHDTVAVVGADVGAHRTVVEVANLDGTTTARRETRHSQSLGPAALETVGGMIDACREELGLPATAVVAGTVATPGIIEPTSGRITLRRTLGEWDAEQITAALSPHIGGVVSVENDASLAALAMSGLPGVPSSFLGLQWGRRLGAGIVLDGQVFRGRTGGAGELGSLLLPDPVTGEVSYLEEVVRVDRLPLLGGVPDRTVEELLHGADAGDPRLRAALLRAIEPLADVVAPLCIGLDLSTVTVSGAIARSGPVLVETFQERLAARGATDVRCRLSPFREDTVLRGAVDNAVDAGWTHLIETAGSTATASSSAS